MVWRQHASNPFGDRRVSLANDLDDKNQKDSPRSIGCERLGRREDIALEMPQANIGT
jgi:hypothetical protein